MDFISAVKNGFSNYATFSGRARRSEYWFWQLFIFLASLAASILSAADGTLDDGTPRAGLFTALAGLVSLALALPSLAVLVRRLHDTGRSAWHVVYWGVIPGVLALVLLITLGIALVGSGADLNSASDVLAWLAVAFAAVIPVMIGNVVLFVFTVIDSKPDNKYGPSPKKRFTATNMDGMTA